MVVLGLAGFFPASIFLTIHQADAGYRKAKKTITLEELRTWAQMVAMKHARSNGGNGEVPVSEIPSYLTHLYTSPPEYVSTDSGDTNCYAMIVWGGGFFHWGFQVGTTNFMGWTNHESPRLYPLAPGIYYQHESGWGLK